MRHRVNSGVPSCRVYPRIPFAFSSFTHFSVVHCIAALVFAPHPPSLFLCHTVFGIVRICVLLEYDTSLEPFQTLRSLVYVFQAPIFICNSGKVRRLLQPLPLWRWPSGSNSLPTLFLTLLLQKLETLSNQGSPPTHAHILSIEFKATCNLATLISPKHSSYLIPL